MYTLIIRKKILTNFFTAYKNERKKYNFDNKNIKNVTFIIKTKKYLI